MSKELKKLMLAIIGFGLLSITVWNIGWFADFKNAIKGDEVASQSPFAAYVVKNYHNCLYPGMFSSGSKSQCKVIVAQLVRLENEETSVKEALRIIDAYERKKLESIGVSDGEEKNQ